MAQASDGKLHLASGLLEMLYVDDDDDDGNDREQTNLILLLFHFGMLSVFRVCNFLVFVLTIYSHRTSIKIG